MPSLILAFALLLPSLAQAHEGLHHVVGLMHGPTSLSPLLVDVAGGLLIAGGILLARRLWQRPVFHGVAGAVLVVAGAGLIAA